MHSNNVIMKYFLGLALILLAGVGPAVAGEGRKADLSHPLVTGWLAIQGQWPAAGGTADSIIIDTSHPDYLYPGRAMIFSLFIPGAGQVYVKRPVRGLFYLATDVAAYYVWRDYIGRGNTIEDLWEAFADSSWSFIRWFTEAGLYRGGEWDRVGVGITGSHNLEYFVADMDGDGLPELFGSTNDPGRLAELIADQDTSAFLRVRRNGNFYENIGKYNQFFSGWSDADPNNPDIEETLSGPIAWSDYRRWYVETRGESNRLRGLAGYAVSAALFNHVLSAADALFSASAWNRGHALKLSGRLRHDPLMPYGVGGVEISLGW